MFVADDGSHGNEVWKSDGTTTGTTLVRDINPDGDSYATNLTRIGGTIFFVASDGRQPRALWKSDGTTKGTVMVQDANAGPVCSPTFFPFARMGSELFFSADDGIHGIELWKSDGRAAGTTLVKDINPGTASSYPGWDSGFASLGKTLLFSADDGSQGETLWRSDGATATVHVTKSAPEP